MVYALPIRYTRMTNSQPMNRGIVWIDYLYEYYQDSYENLLQGKKLIAVLWIADYDEKTWGDDWNDVPAYCNAGRPYENTLKNLQKIELRLGEMPSFPGYIEEEVVRGKFNDTLTLCDFAYNDTTQDREFRNGMSYARKEIVSLAKSLGIAIEG